MADSDRLIRLSDAQREVLRRFHVRRSAKQIGLELGITHWAVNERLRAARHVLGVDSSAQAAALLAASEEGGAYNRIVCDPAPLAEPPPPMVSYEPVEQDRRTGGDFGRLRQERVTYLHEPLASFGLPIPRQRGDRNDLTIKARLLWIGALTLGIVLVVGALVTIAWGIMRIAAGLF